MNWNVFVRVRWKGMPKWRSGVYYGDSRWPSASFWLVPSSSLPP